MIIRQFLHRDPIAASYLLGYGGHFASAVVDPVGDVAPHLAAAKVAEMRIRHVIERHLHADHISKALPDQSQVLPGAYSGSVCGRSVSGNRGSGTAFDNRDNNYFGFEDEEEFVCATASEIPPPPSGAARVRAINSGEGGVTA